MILFKIAFGEIHCQQEGHFKDNNKSTDVRL